MHDIRVIRADGAAFDAAMARRGLPAQSAIMLEKGAPHRAAQTALQEEQARRNALSRQVGEVRRRGEDTAALESEATALCSEMEALEQTAASLDGEIKRTLESLPNVLDADVPDGPDETANVVLKQW